jgi:hypothetical protein
LINLKTLPEYCWTVLKATNELVVVKRGESGYFPQREENAPWDAKNVDHLNEQLGVTKGQAEAMANGSIFGWSTPSADPNNYSDDGEWIKK